MKKTEECFDTYKPNVTVAIPSQDIYPNSKSIQIKGKKTVTLTNDTQLELCNLGRAAMKGISKSFDK